MVMGIKWITVLFLEITLAMNVVISNAVSENGSSSSSPRQNFFKIKRNYNVKSIQSEDGDIIDCVDIYKQPAFKHPALKNHKIQMTPTMLTNTGEPTLKKASEQRQENLHISAAATQIWQRTGSCPEGTIPILRRKQGKSNSKANTVHDNLRKKPSFGFFPDHENNQSEDDSSQLNLLYTNRSVAILHAEGFAYYGGKGDIKVWNPHVEGDDEYSISQVSLKNGQTSAYEAIESGWAVNPSVYGDRKTRLFVYWTVDGSVKTGCFDLTCPGFVQTNNEIALGAAIYPISNPTGLPFQITISILKDRNTTNWWLTYGETTHIGYWPSKLFRILFYQAATVQWGGEVYSNRIGSIHPHTATAMGNGQFPDLIFGQSGMIKRMRVATNSETFTIPQWAYPLH